MSYCDPADVDAWIICHGKLALEESEEPITPSQPDVAFQANLRVDSTSLKNSGAKVTALIPSVLDVSIVTSERGAHDTADGVLIVEKDGKTTLQVYDSQARISKLKLDALAAYLQHSLLYDFTDIQLNGKTSVTVDELYVFGQKVTEAAAIALTVRGDSTATAHLNPGPQCKECRSAYRCPTLLSMV